MVRHKCLILGASGLVGQRLQQRLAQHPMFEIGAVAGSRILRENIWTQSNGA